MYDCDLLFQSKVNNRCWGCLKVSEDVRVLTIEEQNWYLQHVCKSPVNSKQVFICRFCSYFLKKARDFIDHCVRVQEVLNCSVDENDKTNINPLPLKSIHNFTTSNVRIEEFLNYDINIEDTTILDNDIEIDEEDLPLTLLKHEDSPPVEDKRNKKRKKKRRNRDRQDNENIDQGIAIQDGLKVENLLEALDVNGLSDNGVKVDSDGFANGGSCKKKILRAGFTSKMVQETDEYIVIKLSKEQVLQEMADKSSSEEYMRCPYKCVRCVKGYNFEDVLSTHMEKHVAKKGWLECDLCHQYCPNAVSLRGHMKSHTTRYKCKVCGCVRLARQVLLEHHSTCHTAEAVKYTCQQCEFVSSKRTSMQRHIRTRHNRTEKHPCEQCGKVLNSLEALRAHTTHDKSKRMKCDECSRHFVYPALLAQHKMAVHVRGDFYCVECDIRFKSRGSLKLHFKRHKRHRDVSAFKYGCEHCEKRFVFPSTLCGHVATAHGVAAKYSCACGRQYASRDALRAHQRRAHTAHEGRRRNNLTSQNTTGNNPGLFADNAHKKEEEISPQVLQSSS